MVNKIVPVEREHLSAKMLLISLMIILLTDQHSYRGSMPEITILTFCDLSSKYLSSSTRHSVISKGESLLILFAPHKIMACCK